jgi:hypothetical protein
LFLFPPFHLPLTFFPFFTFPPSIISYLCLYLFSTTKWWVSSYRK